jgi:N-acetylglucosaminyldiphosphoundecaprenol N-acetyl-beta-D-mannosaminyltransferase
MTTENALELLPEVALRASGERHGGPLPRRSLFGFDFVSDTDMAAVVDRITGPQPTDELLPLVVTPNVDYIVRLRETGLSDLAAPLRRARYVLPDGQPIVWTSRLTGEPLAARLPGSTMFPIVWKRVVEDRRPVVIVASTNETALLLKREHPDAGVVVPPHFDAEDPSQLAKVVAACLTVIDQVKPEFVFVGISFPKQQRIALALVEMLRATGQPLPLFLLLGGSFEMYLGRVPRAPRWMQAVGLEWMFRFLLEPRRLFRRYFVTDMRFLWVFLTELLRSKSARPPEPA